MEVSELYLSPLEQFEIIPLWGWLVGSVEGAEGDLLMYVLNNADVVLGVGVAELLFVLWLVSYSSLFGYRDRFTLVVHQLVSEGLKMVVERVDKVGQSHLGIMLTLGVFIMLFNLLGLVPFGFCVTAHVVVTQFLALFAWCGLTIQGVQRLGFMWLNVFVPRNVPFVMVPFLSIIELISYVSRVISLSVRLFANMVAGHALLHILIGGVVGVFTLPIPTVVAVMLAGLPTLLVLAIATLELGIAFLQGYVFVVLYLIYLGDALFSH